MGVKVNAPEHRSSIRIQAQNVAASKYVLPQPTCEAKGHLLGAPVVGGRGRGQQFEGRKWMKSWAGLNRGRDREPQLVLEHGQLSWLALAGAFPGEGPLA